MSPDAPDGLPGGRSRHSSKGPSKVQVGCGVETLARVPPHPSPDPQPRTGSRGSACPAANAHLLPSKAGAPSPAARHLAAAKVHGPAKQIHRFPSHSLRARARDDRDVRDDRGLRDDRPHHRHVIPRRAFRRGIRLSGLRGRVREKQTPRLHTHLVKAGAQSETELRGDRLLRADSIRRRELAYTGWVGVRNSEGISSLGSKAMASTFSRLNSMAGDSAVTLGKRMACICPKKKGMKI